MIIRSQRPSQQFTVMKNNVLRDDRISFRARGVLAAILSRPDDWRTSAELLAKQSGGREGRDAIASAMKELREAGYLVTRTERDPATGRIRTVNYIFDEPQQTEMPDLAGTGLAGRGPAGRGKPASYRKNDYERNISGSKKEPSRALVPAGMSLDAYMDAAECEHGFKHFQRCPICERNKK